MRYCSSSVASSFGLRTLCVVRNRKAKDIVLFHLTLEVSGAYFGEAQIYFCIRIAPQAIFGHFLGLSAQILKVESRSVDFKIKHCCHCAGMLRLVVYSSLEFPWLKHIREQTKVLKLAY